LYLRLGLSVEVGLLSSDKSELGGLGTVTISTVSFNRLMALPDALVARKAVSVIIIKRGLQIDVYM
jgi:hypothetical protein